MDLLKEAREVDVKKILSFFGSEFYKNNTKCIFHTDNNRSAFITRGNRLRCMSCNTTLSTLDIIQHFESIQSPRDQAKRVLEIAGQEIKIIDYMPSKKKNCAAGGGSLGFMDRYRLAAGKNLDVAENYLKSRGIDPAVVVPILDQNKIKIGADKLDQTHIFFFTRQFCIYRAKIQDKNFNCGTPAPVCIKANNNSCVWYIVEGIYDALTLIQHNKNVICLNSTANVKKILEKLTDKFYYVIATDNDKSGLECKIILEKYFNDNNIRYRNYDLLYNSKYKDINELYQKGVKTNE